MDILYHSVTHRRRTRRHPAPDRRGGSDLGGHLRRALAVLCCIGVFAPAPTLGNPVIEAGAHFFAAQNGLNAYDGEVIGAQSVAATSSATAGGLRIDGRARASIRSLGIELDTLGGGAVGASIFEGVEFISRQLPSRGAVLNGYQIAIVGRLNATLASISPFSNTPVAPGAGLPGFGQLEFSYFEGLEWRDSALRDIPTPGLTTRTLFRSEVAGSISVPFLAPTPVPVFDPSTLTTIDIRSTATPVGACGTGNACRFVNSFIRPSLGVTSFGLGLALSGQLIDESPAQGTIDAFNSFDLEGLAMLDPMGNVVEGLFRSDSGVDLTLDAFRPDFGFTAAPVPAPPAGWLVCSAVFALALARRRSPVRGRRGPECEVPRRGVSRQGIR